LQPHIHFPVVSASAILYDTQVSVIWFYS